MNNIVKKGLWVLGWIFVFPIPATILLCRVAELPKQAISVLGVVAWIILGVIYYMLFLGVEHYSTMRILCLLGIIAGSVISVFS